MCSAPPPTPPSSLSSLPTQSDQHGWTQAANKTRIRRVSTHTGLKRKKNFLNTPRSHPAAVHKLLFIALLSSLVPAIFHFSSLAPVCLYPLLSEPSPYKLFAQWGIQKLLILLERFSRFPNASLAQLLLYTLDPAGVFLFVAAVIMNRAPSQ